MAVKRNNESPGISRLKLLNDNCLVEVLPPPKEWHGLLIPDCADELKPAYEGALAGRMHEGIVRATGPGKRDTRGVVHPVEVKVGDRVKFYFMGDYYLNWPDSNHRIMRETMVQAVIDAG